MQLRFHWNGHRVQEATIMDAVRGLNQAAAYLQDKTIPRTPKDTGELRRSLVIEPAHYRKLQASVGSNLHYAVRQHEELGYRHKYGEAKFLERSMNDNARQIQRIISNNLRRK